METSAQHARFFSAPYRGRLIPRAGHNLRQEEPAATAAAVLELIEATAQS